MLAGVEGSFYIKVLVVVVLLGRSAWVLFTVRTALNQCLGFQLLVVVVAIGRCSLRGLELNGDSVYFTVVVVMVC